MPFVGRRRFEDEDVEEDDIKDDWEEEDEEPAPKPVAAPEPKKRLSVKQKIAEKEAMRQQNSGNDFDDWDLGGEEEEDQDERRRREKEAQMRSDLANAEALLGSTTLDDKKKQLASDAASSSLANAKPSSKEEWDAFAKDLYSTLIQPKSSRPGFDKHFFPALLTLLTTHGLRDVDMRKGSTKLRELAEAKVKADKEAKKAGGNKRAPVTKPKQVGTASAKNTIDLKAYGDEALDDDLEFM
ncbi:Translation initiation factor 3 subunit J component [Malassezia pachydermatis]